MLAIKKWLSRDEPEEPRKPMFPRHVDRDPHFFLGAFMIGGLFGVMILCLLILLFNEPVGVLLALANMN